MTKERPQMDSPSMTENPERSSPGLPKHHNQRIDHQNLAPVMPVFENEHRRDPSPSNPHQAQVKQPDFSLTSGAGIHKPVSNQESQLDFSNFQYDSYAVDNSNMFLTNTSRISAPQPADLQQGNQGNAPGRNHQGQSNQWLQGGQLGSLDQGSRSNQAHAIPQTMQPQSQPEMTMNFPQRQETLNQTIPQQNFLAVQTPNPEGFSNGKPSSNQGSPGKNSSGNASFQFQQKSPQSQTENNEKVVGFDNFTNTFSAPVPSKPSHHGQSSLQTATVQDADPFGGFNFNFGNQGGANPEKQASNFNGNDFFGGPKQEATTDVFDFKPKKQPQKAAMDVNFNDFFGGQQTRNEQPSNQMNFEFASQPAPKKPQGISANAGGNGLDFNFDGGFSLTPPPAIQKPTTSNNSLGLDMMNFGHGQQQNSKPQSPLLPQKSHVAPQGLSNQADKYSAFDDLLSSGQSSLLGPSFPQNGGGPSTMGSQNTAHQGGFGFDFSQTTQAAQSNIHPSKLL